MCVGGGSVLDEVMGSLPSLFLPTVDEVRRSGRSPASKWFVVHFELKERVW